jgi:hypothetical protein
MLPKGVLSKGNKSKGLHFDEVLVPVFEIVSNPTIKLSDIQRRRFNLKHDEGALIIHNREDYKEEV